MHLCGGSLVELSFSLSRGMAQPAQHVVSRAVERKFPTLTADPAFPMAKALALIAEAELSNTKSHWKNL